MAQIITAQFITDTGFATGLTPALRITDTANNTVSNVTMTEDPNGYGNYSYNFTSFNESILYFFNIDAGSDTVINRYVGSNNTEQRVLYMMSGGGSGGTNAKKIDDKEEKLIKKIVKAVMEEVKPLVEKESGDIQKEVETLGVTVSNIPQTEVEFDYDTILSSVEKNGLKIVKKVDSIKIPKYDDKPIKELIKKTSTSVLDKISQTSTSKQLDEVEDEIMEEIKQRTKGELKDDDIHNIVMEALEMEDDMKMMMLGEDEDFKSLNDEDE